MFIAFISGKIYQPTKVVIVTGLARIFIFYICELRVYFNQTTFLSSSVQIDSDVIVMVDDETQITSFPRETELPSSSAKVSPQNDQIDYITCAAHNNACNVRFG